MTQPIGPQTVASLTVLSQKYCQRGETYRDVCNRVAGVLADGPSHYHSFRDILLDGRFIPGGRILASMGTTKRTTPYNCFVSGTIDDAIDTKGGILARHREACLTLRMGGGIGYDFSTLRPGGDLVRSLDSRASGPVSYIKMYDSMGATISSSGERRGAQMGILRVDHPDIEEFIYVKQNKNTLSCFNLSIAITDGFMQAVARDDTFDLGFEGRTYRTIRAKDLWETIMRSTWDWAEPGVIFIDRINDWNNLRYCERIAATNPCSEQPLPPFGACLLGSFNLVKYLKPLPRPSKLEGRYWFDHAAMAADVPVVVRAMDNVVDQAIYPLPEQQQAAFMTRRMGLGVMGAANAIEATGPLYGDSEFVSKLEAVLGLLKNSAYQASAELAAEKGPFPLYTEEYLSRPFIKGLSPSVLSTIAKNGVRNSHLTSIAPTGTTAFAMDNVSSGIEPVFSFETDRNVRLAEGIQSFKVQDYGYANLAIQGRTAAEVTAKQHVDVLVAAQRHVDSAISKTCNVPSGMPWHEFKGIYARAYQEGAKGCTTFQDGGMREGVMSASTPLADCANGVCSV